MLKVELDNGSKKKEEKKIFKEERKYLKKNLKNIIYH